MDPEAVLRPSAHAALDAWRALIEANREQIERLREDTRASDFYAARAPQFRPGRMPSPEQEQLEAIARREDAWLDIGAGGGRFAVPLARRVREVVALDPSPSMRETLAAAAAEAGVANIRIVDGQWPEAVDGVPEVDVSLASHVLYDQDGLGGFLEAMERRTRRLCAVILGNRAPSGGFEPVWTELHGEPLCRLPGLHEFLAVLGALDRRFEVRTHAPASPEPLPAEEAHAAARRLYWVAEGSERDARLGALLREHFGTADGLVALPPRIAYTALVTWPPRG
jgi:SAM-dependent methyltransferase